MQHSLESVQAEYIHHLANARPGLEELLADVNQVLTAIMESSADNSQSREPRYGRTSHDSLCELNCATPLESARAAYIAYLRARPPTFDQVVADIAAVCASLFLQSFVDQPDAHGQENGRQVMQRAPGGARAEAASSARCAWLSPGVGGKGGCRCRVVARPSASMPTR